MANPNEVIVAIEGAEQGKPDKKESDINIPENLSADLDIVELETEFDELTGEVATALQKGDVESAVKGYESAQELILAAKKKASAEQHVNQSFDIMDEELRELMGQLAYEGAAFYLDQAESEINQRNLDKARDKMRDGEKFLNAGLNSQDFGPEYLTLAEGDFDALSKKYEDLHSILRERSEMEAASKEKRPKKPKPKSSQKGVERAKPLTMKPRAKEDQIPEFDPSNPFG